MRTIEIGTQEHTKVVCLDEPGAGGACYEYQVLSSETEIPFAEISFQNGPVKEAGVNGCHHEDLISIVIDRLLHFQAGEWKCQENDEALKKFEEGLMCLNKRTQDCRRRGIEGTSKK